MIKNKTYMNFGTQDIRLTAAVNHKSTGFLYCLSQDPMDMDKFLKYNCPESGRDAVINDAEVVMIFDNTKSIDTLIKMLTNVKKSMEMKPDEEQLSFMDFVQKG